MTKMILSPTGEELIQVDLSNVADGMYIVRVAGNGKYHAQQVIKKN
jgi:hypothetical protein